MKYKYIVCDLLTLSGIKKAEKYQAKGYKSLLGFNTITFEIPQTKR